MLVIGGGIGGLATAIALRRADWGVAIAPVARSYNLGFIPFRVERYDFVIPAARWDRPAVTAFCALSEEPETRRVLTELGFLIETEEVT